MSEPDALLSPQEQAQALQAIADVAQRAVGPLARARAAQQPWQAVVFVATLHRGIDRIAAASDANPTPAHLQAACAPGCHACCSARVEVSEPEALWIAHHLAQGEAAAQARRLTRLRAQAAARQREAPTATQPRSCAFLDDGLCGIYNVRPAVCRKAHSLSSAACNAGAAEIPQNLDRVLQCDVLMVGTRQAYARQQLAAGTHELAAAVLAALVTPDALDSWWLGPVSRTADQRTAGN
jgi:uncharacterized protein